MKIKEITSKTSLLCTTFTEEILSLTYSEIQKLAIESVRVHIFTDIYFDDPIQISYKVMEEIFNSTVSERRFEKKDYDV